MNETLTIDAENRVINVPKDYVIGVESDEKANRIQFQCPRKIGNGMSLTNCAIYINYRNANKDVDRYICDNALVTDTEMDTCTFEWVVPRKACAYKGTIYFVVCAILSGEDGAILQEWNTTLAKATVLEGLEAETIDPDSDTYDVIQQLIRIGSESTQKARQAADECITYADKALRYSAEAKQAVSSVPTIDDASVATDKVWSSDKVNSVMDPANTPYMASSFYNDLTTENVCYMLQTRNVVLTNDMSVTVSEGVTSTVDIPKTLVTPVVFIKTKDGNFACVDGNGMAYTGSFTIETETSFTATITAKYGYISRDMFDDDVIEELDGYAVLDHNLSVLSQKLAALIDDTSNATNKTWSASKIGKEIDAAKPNANLYSMTTQSAPYSLNDMTGTVSRETAADTRLGFADKVTVETSIVSSFVGPYIHTKNTILEPGQTYTFSCYVKASTELDGYALLFRSENVTNPAATNPNLSTDWQRYICTGTAKDEDLILTWYGNAFPVGSELYIADIKIEKGSVATPWTPNPNDYLSPSQVSASATTNKNLLKRSSFLFDSDPYNSNWSWASYGSLYSWEFTRGGYHYICPNLSDSGHSSHSSWGINVHLALMGIVPGDTITISYDIKGEPSWANNGLEITHPTSSNSAFNAASYDCLTGGSFTSLEDTPGEIHTLISPDKFTRVSGSWTVDSDFADSSYLIYIFFGGGGQNADSTRPDMYVRNVKIEKGSVATPWVPHETDYIYYEQITQDIKSNPYPVYVPSAKAVYDAISSISSTGSSSGSSVAIDDTSTTVTDKTWSASKIYSETSTLESNIAALSTKVSTLESNSGNVTIPTASISRDMLDDDLVEELDGYAVLEHNLSVLSVKLSSLTDRVSALEDAT